MLLQPLSDLRGEINRLMIAGSRFANNDPRLQKLLPIFQKMGEKAPVFQKIAGNIESLLKAPTTASAEHLTALSTLLYAVLYTQGKSIVEGEITAQAPLMNIDEVKTPLTYLELQPTITALTTTGSGRYEIIHDAFTRGLIHDVRLYTYIARGIEDKYSEIADYIKENIIPAIGAPLIPFLLQDFALVDDKANAARIEILDQLGHSLPDDLIQTIMDGNDAKLQVALIPSLSRDPQYLPLLLDAAKSKKKATKEAALIGLARSQTTDAWQYIMNIFHSVKNAATLALLTTALRPLDNLRGCDDEIMVPLKEAIHELASFQWHDDYKKTAGLFETISAYVQIFYEKNNATLTDLVMQFSTQLNEYNAQKSGKKSAPAFKEFTEQFDTLQITIALYFAHLQLAEDDSMFEPTIEAIHLQDHYAKLQFINHLYGSRTKVHFIYRALTNLFKADELLHFTNHLDFLMTYNGTSPFADEIQSRYYITYSSYITLPDPHYADPRWADYFYDYCSTKEFLVVLRSAYGKRGYNTHNAMNILALLNALEPKNSPRMNDLLQEFIRFLSYDKIGPIFAYLEERMGKAAHPIILKKIDAEIERIANRTSPDTLAMNAIQQRITAQSQPE